MIKALVTAGRPPRISPMIVLGLSGENVSRLAAGEPILLDLAELGLPSTQIVIMYGRTEADITAELLKNGLA